MIVYVAGSSSEPERVRRAMGEVVGRGWTLAQDWLADIEREGAANPTDDDVRRRCARADRNAVSTATVFWLLAPEQPTRGAWVELGVAISVRAEEYRRFGHSDRLVVVSGNGKQSIFCSLADREFSDDSDVCQWFATTMGATCPYCGQSPVGRCAWCREHILRGAAVDCLRADDAHAHTRCSRATKAAYR